MHPVLDLAKKLSLNRVVDVLQAFPVALPEPAPPLPPPEGPALAQAVRTGLAPRFHEELLTEIMPGWKVTPGSLDQALIAWDLLHETLFGPDASSDIERLRDVARAGGALTRQPGRRWPSPGQAETRRFLLDATQSLDALDDSQLLEAANTCRLGAYRQYTRRTGNDDPVLLERTRAFALSLQRARLTSLACAHLDELYFGCGYRPALWNLVDVLLDAGVGGVLALVESAPPEDGGLRPTREELLLYAKVREGLREERAEEWREWAEQHRKLLGLIKLPPDELGRLNPLATIAYTEVALRLALPLLPIEVVAPAASALPAWRHGFLMTTIAAARESNPRSRDYLEVLDKQLQQFGNDEDLWWSIINVVPPKAVWGVGFLAALLREAVAQPSNPAVWKGVARVFGQADTAKPAIDEINGRLAAQATLA